MNVLITGGAGFIGSNIAKKLVEHKHTVTIFDVLTPKIHGVSGFDVASIGSGVAFVKDDVRNKNGLLSVLNNHDAVIHLAAETGTGQSMYEVEQYFDVNVQGTALLLDVLTNNKTEVKKVVVASSRAIYGEGKYSCKECGIVYPEQRNAQDLEKGVFNVKCPQCEGFPEAVPTDEDSKITPMSVYGLTKQFQEQMVLNVCKNRGLPAIAFRYQNVYGPGQSLKNPYTGILSIFSTRIRNNKSIEIYEDGLESRDFVYIDDVVDATVLGLEKNDGAGVYNVGSGTPIAVVEVAQKIRELFNSSAPINISGRFRIGDIRHNMADVGRVKRDLGFIPKVTFKEGIEKFIDWVKTQPVPEDLYEKSVIELKEKGFSN